MGDFSALAQRIKKLRLSLGMTQRQFAQKAGCTAATLSAYENGSKSPSLEIVKGIAEAFDVSIDWLCGLSDQRNRNDKIETYNDLIRVFFEIERSCGANFTLIHALDVCDFKSSSKYELNGLSFREDEAQQFISEWGKMKKLHDENVIDDELYGLWKEKVLNKEYAFTPDGGFADLVKTN